MGLLVCFALCNLFAPVMSSMGTWYHLDLASIHIPFNAYRRNRVSSLRFDMLLALIWACYETGRRSLNMSRCASLIWGVGIIHCTKMK